MVKYFSTSLTLRFSKSLIAVLVTHALWLFPNQAGAQNPGRGQELFEHHCQSCHFDFHERRDRHVKSLSELKSRITAWSTHTSTEWGDDEVEDVLRYLNSSFYKFPEKTL